MRIYLFFFISLFFATTTLAATPSQPELTVTLPTSPQWQASKSNAMQSPGYQVRNYSIKGQSALTGDKIQLIDAAYSAFPGYYTPNLKKFINVSITTLKKNCPDLTWKTLSLAKKTVVFEYQINNCKLWGIQYGLSKVFAGKTYFHQINYIAHRIPSNAEKQKYLAVIESATVK